MSQENVEIVRRALDAWNRRDLDTLIAAADPGIEYVNAPTAVEPGTRRGVAEVAGCGGRSGRPSTAVSRSTGSLTTATRSSPWVALSGGVGEADARCEDRFLGSWKVRNGKIIRFEALGFGRTEVQAALEAAGLREYAVTSACAKSRSPGLGEAVLCLSPDHSVSRRRCRASINRRQLIQTQAVGCPPSCFPGQHCSRRPRQLTPPHPPRRDERMAAVSDETADRESREGRAHRRLDARKPFVRPYAWVPLARGRTR